jgi:hypothetical protein
MSENDARFEDAFAFLPVEAPRPFVHDCTRHASATMKDDSGVYSWYFVMDEKAPLNFEVEPIGATQTQTPTNTYKIFALNAKLRTEKHQTSASSAWPSQETYTFTGYNQKLFRSYCNPSSQTIFPGNRLHRLISFHRMGQRNTAWEGPFLPGVQQDETGI